MIKVIWDKDKISMITNQIDAALHKHWTMQLFISLEKDLEIYISGKRIICRCIIVNRNVPHSFSTDDYPHYSLLIEPTSNLAYRLDQILCGEEYYIFEGSDIIQVRELGFQLIYSNDLGVYKSFIAQLYGFLGIEQHTRPYDDRIQELLQYIRRCDCNDHSISSFADKVSLSPSRLSHLFREQVGIPLKSYIQFHQMQKAFFALLNGKTITEAAMSANFDTPSHFAAVTKRMMGMPASISLKDSVFLKVSD